MLYDIRKASYSPVFYDERDFLDVNVPLGTIIDKTIVHPHRKQFFFYVNQPRLFFLLLLFKCIFLMVLS